MVQGVYVDILLCVNFMIHTAILLLLQKLCHLGGIKPRLFIAAAVGSLFSLTIFLPPFSCFVNLLIKVGSGILMTRIAFPWKGKHCFLRENILLLLMGSLLYGVLSLMKRLYALSGMYLFDQAVYFHIKTPVFIFCLAGAYLIIWTMEHILERLCPPEQLYDVQLQIDGKSISLKGFLDTGNCLHEPFSSFPVILCSENTAVNCLPEDLFEAMLGINNDKICKIRQIPISTVSGTGLISAVRGEELTLKAVNGSGKGEIVCHHFYLAMTPEKLGDETWQILLNKDLFAEERISLKK